VDILGFFGRGNRSGDYVMIFTPSPLKDATLAKCWELVKTPKPNEKQGLPAMTWGAMGLRTRAVLVMLGAKSMDDPREVARRPWASLSDQDREGIASVAREMKRELKDAACLF
jgi:hypothetical protein